MLVPGDRITVVLADDHVLVRGGMRALLASARDVQVIGEAGDGAEAVAVTERLRPDVLVMDLDMPRMDGVAATREIEARQLSTKVLVLSMHTEEEQLLSVLEAGAAGYLTKTAAQRELADAIRAVAYGDVYVRPVAGRVLARGVTRRDPVKEERARFETLSEREQEVLRQMALGYSGSEVARQLGISPKTVETYKQRIGEKVGLHHRTDYVRFALRLGMLNEMA
jgi:DNA-binding NarL/FixJ family response regulator